MRDSLYLRRCMTEKDKHINSFNLLIFKPCLLPITFIINLLQLSKGKEMLLVISESLYFRPTMIPFYFVLIKSNSFQLLSDLFVVYETTPRLTFT